MPGPTPPTQPDPLDPLEPPSADARDAPAVTPPAAAPASRLSRVRETAEAVTEPLVGAAAAALGAARDTIRDLELPGHRIRRVRRLGQIPLPSLTELHPEARLARPVEVGLRTIDVDAIRGTAVGGGDQRGGDFLPLKAFRGQNWAARWQRLRRAHDQLVTLPPIDVVKYADGYWVIDGHNRVAVALYAGQVGIDASVVELVPPGGHRTEAIGSLASELEASRVVRGRVSGEVDGRPPLPAAPDRPAGDG